MKNFLIILLVIIVSCSKTPEELELERQLRIQRDCKSEFKAYVIAQGFIKKRLNFPDTAEFPNRLEKDVSINNIFDCVHNITSYVNSQNVFGVTVRTDYQIKVRFNEYESDWSLLEINM